MGEGALAWMVTGVQGESWGPGGVGCGCHCSVCRLELASGDRKPCRKPQGGGGGGAGLSCERQRLWEPMTVSGDGRLGADRPAKWSFST